MSTHPELAIVTQWGADHPVVRSLVSQLLEHGIHFDQGTNQSLLGELPANLEPYRAFVLDSPSFQKVRSDTNVRKRLEAFAQADGFVFLLNDPTESSSIPKMHAEFLIDLTNFHLVQDILVHVHLSRFSKEANRVQLDRSEDEILERLKQRQVRKVQEIRDWSEMTQHHWKAMKALIEVGEHTELCDTFIAAIRETAKEIPPALNHDKLGGYFATVWFYEQTGDREPMEKARARLDELIAKRPRHMDVLTGTGFADDPLGLKQGEDGLYTFYFSNSTNRRQAICNEELHFHGPTFGAFARITGERKYLDEVLRHVEFIRAHHQRTDGLIAHWSSDGKSPGHVWSRGQFHALIGMLYLLEEMERKDPAFERVVEVIRKAGQSLIKHQDADTGLWRNLIDHPDSRLETSGTAGFCYVFARCIREDWLDRKTFEPMVRKAWQGLKRMYWRGGFAANCRGSGAAVDNTYYLGRPQGYSAGPPLAWALMALLELQKLDRETTK